MKTDKLLLYSKLHNCNVVYSYCGELNDNWNVFGDELKNFKRYNVISRRGDLITIINFKWHGDSIDFRIYTKDDMGVGRIHQPKILCYEEFRDDYSFFSFNSCTIKMKLTREEYYNFSQDIGLYIRNNIK